MNRIETIIARVDSMPVRSPAAITELIRYADHGNMNVREAALQSMSRASVGVARMAARSGLSDRSAVIRSLCVDILGERGCRQRDSGRLAGALADSSWVVRCSAATALGSLAGKDAFAALVSRLTVERHPAVRRDIYHALAEFGQQSLPVIESAISSEMDKLAQCGLVISRYAISGNGFDGWLELMRDPDALVRDNAFNGLAVKYIRIEDVESVLAELEKLVMKDPNPGNVGDAQAKMKEIRSKHA